MIILCLSSLLCTLRGQSALEQVVNLDFENERLSYILTKLDDKYDLSIRANESLLPTDSYTYSFKDVLMKDVLTILLYDKGLYFREYKPDHIIIVQTDMISDEIISDNLTLSNSTVMRQVEEEIIQVGAANIDGSKALIQGSLVDARNFTVVPSALLLNQTSGDYISTDLNGAFRLELDTGRYQFVINTVTHEPRSLLLHIKGTDALEILLEPKAHLIDEVIISASSNAQRTKQAIIGLEQLSRKDIKELSFFMGEADVVKSVLSIAGVNSSGDGASGYNVRGGSIDQNLIMQDGAIIFNPSHVLGFFSTFNPDIVRNTTLHKGHLSANYGGRVASVLDINIKDPTTELLTVKGGVGMIASKLALDMPIIKGKSGLLLSARRTYAHWMLNEVMNSRVRNSDAFFYDVNAKWMYRFSTRTKFSVSYFQSRDEFSYNQEFGYGWQNKIGTAEFSHILSDNASLRIGSTLGQLQNNQFVPQGTFAFDLSSGIKYRQHSIEYLTSRSDHVVKIGAEWIKNGIQPEILQAINESVIREDMAEKEKGREMAVYINDNIEFSDRVSMDVGVRYSRYHQTGPAIVNTYENPSIRSRNTIVGQQLVEGRVESYGGIEPRIALRYSFTPSWSIKASYNRARQYLQLLSTTSTPTPVDIWQVSNRYLEPLVSDSYSVSTSADIGSFNISLDLYYRRLYNTIDYKDFADLLLQTNTETQVLIGEGRARGIELAVNKSTVKMSLKFSYAYARSENQIRTGQGESINFGEWYPASFDQPHTVKLFVNWNTSKIDRVAINFLYNTGRPIVAPIGNYQTGGIVVPDFSLRNAFRLPAYHRLDVSYTLLLNRRKSARLKHDISLSLYNVYGRANPFSVFLRQQQNSSTGVFRLAVIGAVIPALQYNFQF